MAEKSVKRVVITGIGMVTSLGRNSEETFSNLLAMKCHRIPIPEKFERSYTFKSRFYVPLPLVSLSNLNLPSVYEQAMQSEDIITITAVHEALSDAGFSIEKDGKKFTVKDLPPASVILGCGVSGLENGFKSYVANVFPQAEELGKEIDTRFRFNRLVVSLLMPNSIAAWTSIMFGLNSESFTINASCASGTIAIGEAYRKIATGQTGMVICGGIENFSDEFGGLMRGFDVLGALTQSADGIPRPFDINRSGFLFSEGGGAVLILEEREAAIKRNARIYAEISNFEHNNDAFNIVQIDKSGQQILSLLKKLTKNQKIDYLNTHGTGTSLNDEVEAEVIKKIFGDQDNQPYLNSTKGLLGHTIGASGAIEAAVTALSIYHNKIHGNLIDDSLENLNLPKESINTEIKRAISVSYGFGGHNAGLLLEKNK